MYLKLVKETVNESTADDQGQIEIIAIEDSWEAKLEKSLKASNDLSTSASCHNLPKCDQTVLDEKSSRDIIHIDDEINENSLKSNSNDCSFRNGINVSLNKWKRCGPTKSAHWGKIDNHDIIKGGNIKQRKQFEKFINQLSDNRDLSKVCEPENKKYQESSECCICLDLPKTTKWKPWNCDHLFWYPWLRSWWNVTNACPLCKITFKFIVKLTNTGAEEGREEVKDKKPDVEQIYFSSIEQSCYIWGRDDNEGQLLIWDYWDIKVCHTYWDNLDVIPDTDWFWVNWRIEERRYSELRPSNGVLSDIQEEQHSSDNEESKNYDSENDEEYDPKSKKFQQLMDERESKKYQVNWGVQIFNEDIIYEDCFEHSNSYQYIPRYNTRNSSSYRSSRYIRPTRELNKRKSKGEYQKPSKKFKNNKRELKFRSKVIDDSESEGWNDMNNKSKDSWNKEELKRLTRASSKRIQSEEIKGQTDRKLKRIIKNNDIKNNDTENNQEDEISKVHSSQLSSLLSSTNENDDNSSEKLINGKSQYKNSNQKRKRPNWNTNNSYSQTHNALSQITSKSSHSSALQIHTQKQKDSFDLASLSSKQSYYMKPLLFPHSSSKLSSLNLCRNPKNISIKSTDTKEIPDFSFKASKSSNPYKFQSIKASDKKIEIEESSKIKKQNKFI